MKINDLMGRGSLLVAVCLLLCVATSTTSGEYIQFTFNGEVTEIGGAPWDPWTSTQLGDSVTVQYVFDSNAEDGSGHSQFGRYTFLDLTLTIGDVNQTATSGGIWIDNDTAYWGDDQYAVVFTLGSEASGAISLSGYDMFSSDALPTDLDWTQYATVHHGVLRFEADPMNRFVMYQLTSWSAEVVPAAPTLFVLLCGAVRKRRRR